MENMTGQAALKVEKPSLLNGECCDNFTRQFFKPPKQPK
jgi:hypothetical protein